ncbi:hypothetical protein QJS66_01835 [Kocuria rhizophila]|nr:hypothetical protein QJS66_01835 [Kocuria rhizophila]
MTEAHVGQRPLLRHWSSRGGAQRRGQPRSGGRGPRGRRPRARPDKRCYPVEETAGSAHPAVNMTASTRSRSSGRDRPRGRARVRPLRRARGPDRGPASSACRGG